MKVRSVFIEGMKVHMRCGVYREERELGVQADVSVRVVSGEFVDYQELYNLIKRVASGTFTYIEEFQDALLEEIINKWNPDEVIIKTIKVSVPFQHSFERAGVELRWQRER